MRKLRKICLFLHDTFKRLLEKLFGPWPKMGLSEYPGKENVLIYKINMIVRVSLWREKLANDLCVFSEKFSKSKFQL